MTRSRGRGATSVALSILGVTALSAAEAPQPVGGEFQVNTYTSSSQNAPAAAMDDSGALVVVWKSNGQDGFTYGVFGRRYDAAGTPLAGEFQVNTRTTDLQSEPAIAVDGSGAFVVAWQSNLQDGAGFGIFAQRFDASGAGVGAELQVNTYTTANQANPRVAAAAGGSFVVVWHSNGQDGEFYGVFARRFDSAGAALATEFQVNTFTDNLQAYPAVAADADGDFVVAWRSYQDYNSTGVFARRFSSAGLALGVEFRVNTFTPGAQFQPAVDLGPDGDFVVAWLSNAQDGAPFSDGVFAQRFSSSGAPLAAEFQVHTFTLDDQVRPQVALDGSNDFVILWQSRHDGDGSYGVFLRRHTAAGVALGAEHQVNTYATGNQAAASIAASAAGDFVVVWSSAQDGHSLGVFAQRFAVETTLDVDDDGEVAALTDGLLVLRFLFGFTGSTLTAGAVGEECARCDGASIEAYLAAVGATLDVDGDVELDALTDGLLVLRYLFGFTGAALVNGAFDADNCTRCDGPAIEGHLNTLV